MSAVGRCTSMAADELHETDPGEVKLPVVRPRAPHDPERGLPLPRRPGPAEVAPREAAELGHVRYGGEVEDVAEGSCPEELLEEPALVDALVPGPEVLRVEVDVELPQAGQGGDAAAEFLPWVVLGRHGEAVDVWLGLPVRSREVEFRD